MNYRSIFVYYVVPRQLPIHPGGEGGGEGEALSQTTLTGN